MKIDKYMRRRVLRTGGACHIYYSKPQGAVAFGGDGIKYYYSQSGSQNRLRSERDDIFLYLKTVSQLFYKPQNGRTHESGRRRRQHYILVFRRGTALSYCQCGADSCSGGHNVLYRLAAVPCSCGVLPGGILCRKMAVRGYEKA